MREQASPTLAVAPLYRPSAEATAPATSAFRYPRLVRTQFRLPAPTSPFHQAVLAYEREQRRGLRVVFGAATVLFVTSILGCFFLGRWTAPSAADPTALVARPEASAEASARIRALDASNTALKLELVAAEASKERLGRMIVASIFEARAAELAASAHATGRNSAPTGTVSDGVAQSPTASPRPGHDD